MTSISSKAFFEGQGAKGICSAFLRELQANGRIEPRGDKGIDEFIALINQNAEMAKSFVKQNSKGLKVFHIYRCWMNPRGRYLVAAKSMTAAAKTLGCSTYHVKNYGLELSDTDPRYTMAMVQPGTVFKQDDSKTEYKPLV
ncbi:hypothetical protein REH81_12060 [Vibrio rotiferianus]